MRAAGKRASGPGTLGRDLRLWPSRRKITKIFFGPLCKIAGGSRLVQRKQANAVLQSERADEDRDQKNRNEIEGDKICINEMMKGNMKRQWRESMDLGINYVWKGFPDGSK